MSALLAYVASCYLLGVAMVVWIQRERSQFEQGPRPAQANAKPMERSETRAA